MNATQLIEAFDRELGKSFDLDLFDAGRGPDDAADTIEVAMDAWTLVIESWPDGHAFIALDDEPETDDPAELAAILNDVFASALEPLAAVDGETGGRISTLLLRSGDPLSEVFAQMLERGGGR